MSGRRIDFQRRWRPATPSTLTTLTLVLPPLLYTHTHTLSIYTSRGVHVERHTTPALRCYPSPSCYSRSMKWSSPLLSPLALLHPLSLFLSILHTYTHTNRYCFSSLTCSVLSKNKGRSGREIGKRTVVKDASRWAMENSGGSLCFTNRK